MAGTEGERLVAMLCELRETEFGEAQAGKPRAEWMRGPWEDLPGCPTRPDAEIVTELREELARLAQAAGGSGRGREQRAVQAALDGAELVIRAELATGPTNPLGSHLPSFVFMVVLPGLGNQRALELSRRAAELLEAPGG